jgi:hypothetical protein
MPSNGYRRKEAKAPKLESVGEVMGQGGNSRVSEAMPSVQAAMRQGGKTIPRGQTGVPSIQEVLRQGGKK